MSVVSPTAGLMDPPPHCASPIMGGMGGSRTHSHSHSASIKTEHLALIGFAARLGSSMTSDALEATQTREDAQLLMNLLHPESLLGGGRRRKDTADTADADVTNDDHDHHHHKQGETRKRSHESTTTKKRGNEFTFFSFTCPSLSIDADRDGTGGVMGGCPEQAEAASAASAAANGSERADQPDGTPTPHTTSTRPSQLFRRSVSVTDRDGVKDAVESVARNVLQSFAVALEWRARVWIDSLTRAIFLRQERSLIERYGEVSAEDLEEQQRQEYEEGEEEEGGGDVYEGEAADDVCIDEECDDDDDDDDAEEEEEEEEEEYQQDHLYMYNKEMAVIDTLARVMSEVSVRDVKTTFRVLPQVADRTAKGATPPSVPPPKKRKIRQVTLENQDQDAEPEQGQGQGQLSSRNDERRYDVTHGILFEAVATVSTGGGGEQQIILTAPGSIVGTFFNATGGEGEEVLVGVTVNLDTDALALSMERNSRYLVRKAAEVDMSAAPPAQTSRDGYAYPPSDVPVPEVSTTAYADMYPQAAVVTPKHGVSPPSSFSSAGSDRDITEDLTIPPPVPCLNLVDEDNSANAPPLKTISPTLMSESDSWCLFTPKQTLAKSVLPSLVSPSPTHQYHQGLEEETPHAEESEWYSFRGKQARNDGPSLPALVEVACAAMCAAT